MKKIFCLLFICVGFNVFSQESFQHTRGRFMHSTTISLVNIFRERIPAGSTILFLFGGSEESDFIRDVVESVLSQENRHEFLPAAEALSLQEEGRIPADIARQLGADILITGQVKTTGGEEPVSWELYFIAVSVDTLEPVVKAAAFWHFPDDYSFYAE